MAAKGTTLPAQGVEQLILEIRGQRVLLDQDLARLYAVTTSRLNEQVTRNRHRFPEDFMFRLSRDEWAALRSQNAISNDGRGGRTHAPRVFTEQGVAMLSSVLRSRRAVEVNIAIMRAFVRFRQMAPGHHALLGRLDALERRVGGHDAQFQAVFKAIRRLIEGPPVPNTRRIGFDQE